MPVTDVSGSDMSQKLNYVLWGWIERSHHSLKDEGCSGKAKLLILHGQKCLLAIKKYSIKIEY